MKTKAKWYNGIISWTGLIMVSSLNVHVKYTAVLLASSSETYMRLLMITVLHLSCEIRQLQAVYARVLQ